MDTTETTDSGGPLTEGKGYTTEEVGGQPTPVGEKDVRFVNGDRGELQRILRSHTRYGCLNMPVPNKPRTSGEIQKHKEICIRAILRGGGAKETHCGRSGRRHENQRSHAKNSSGSKAITGRNANNRNKGSDHP